LINIDRRRRSPSRSIERRIAERITATDPTSRAIQIQKLLAEEQDKSQPVPQGNGFASQLRQEAARD